MKDIKGAISSLKEGKFVLIHDHDGRENETDFLIAAEFISNKRIAQMRIDGGGLICVAVDRGISKRLGLPFTSDILKTASVDFPVLNHLEANDIPYDGRSSFSVTINHRKTFTGITDNDRAFTIRKFAELCSKLYPPSKVYSASKSDTSSSKLYSNSPGGLNSVGPGYEFGMNFRSPGHVHLLISSGLERREGHTELATALLEMAGLIPVAAICEMMDEKTGNALSGSDAREYARNNGLIFLEADDVKETYQKRE